MTDGNREPIGTEGGTLDQESTRPSAGDSRPSSLAFVGAGALGQAYAGMLAKDGRTVTLVATPSGAAHLLTAGRICLRGTVSLEVSTAAAPAAAGVVGITADPRDLPDRSGLIFTTKGHQLPAAISNIRAAWPRPGDADSWVAGVQNGIVKDDLLADAFGLERVVGAVTILAGQRAADGSVTVTSRGGTYLGEFSGASSDRVTAAIGALAHADIPAEASRAIRSVLWSKACNAVGVFGVCVLARCGGPTMMRNPDLIRAYYRLIHETAAIASAYGVEVGDYPGFPIRTYLAQGEAVLVEQAAARAAASAANPGGTESLPSMVQDLLAGRPMESDQIFGDIVARAERAGVPIPSITLARDLISGLNRLSDGV